MNKRRFSSLITTTAITLFILLGLAKSASAALTVDTFVSARPANMSDLSLSRFVDTLSTNDEHYLAIDPVIFKITVRNTGTETVREISVVDTVPTYLGPHPIGLPGWNEANRTVAYQIPYLVANQSNDYLIPMKIFSNADLPGNPFTVTCVTNSVQATGGGQIANDTSQFCIEKRPPTGPSSTPAPEPKATTAPQASPTTVPTATPSAQATQPSATPTPTTGPINVTTVPNTGPSAGILVAGFELATLGIGIAIKRRFS